MSNWAQCPNLRRVSWAGTTWPWETEVGQFCQGAIFRRRILRCQWLPKSEEASSAARTFLWKDGCFKKVPSLGITPELPSHQIGLRWAWATALIWIDYLTTWNSPSLVTWTCWSRDGFGCARFLCLKMGYPKIQMVSSGLLSIFPRTDSRVHGTANFQTNPADCVMLEKPPCGCHGLAKTAPCPKEDPGGPSG